METLEQITLYRFRVRTQAGSESLSPIAATRRPIEGEAEAAPAEEVLQAEDENQPEPMLANLRWSADAFDHDDHATMLVDAPDLDGRTLQFEVEHRQGEAWTRYDTVAAKVKEGRAEAILQLHHPAPGEPQASAADLRFRCELLGEERKAAGGAPAGPVDEIALYRFRVRTADGRQAVSRVLAARHLPKARLAGAREVQALSGPAAGEAPSMLANPRWSEGSFGHGEEATMLVDAPGLDGRTVVFHVEHRQDEEWTDYHDVEATIENGVAEAPLQLQHPAPGEAETAPADLRFACELI